MVAIPDRLDDLGDYITLLRSRFDEPVPDPVVVTSSSSFPEVSVLSSQAHDSSVVTENANPKNKVPPVSFDTTGQGLAEPQSHQSLNPILPLDSSSLHLDSTLVESSAVSESFVDQAPPLTRCVQLA
jgi:hypothetical protein